jgi:predicted transposase YdaD
MAKRFDATFKGIITRYAYDWARHLGLPPTVRLRVVDSELSTVTAAADRVILIDAPYPCVLNIELMASHDLGIERRLFGYCGLLVRQYGLPVHTVLVLLRPEANSPNFSGRQHWRSPYGASSAMLEYDVFRLWETPLDLVLSGGPGVLPLAPLTLGADKAMPEVVKALDTRFQSELTPAEAAEMWTATYTLMGLRFPPEVSTILLRGVRHMRESSTYQAILEEGRREGLQEGGLKEMRRFMLRLGTGRFGPPTPAIMNRLESESGLERLEELAERLVDAKGWDELFS